MTRPQSDATPDQPEAQPAKPSNPKESGTFRWVSITSLERSALIDAVGILSAHDECNGAWTAVADRLWSIVVKWNKPIIAEMSDEEFMRKVDEAVARQTSAPSPGDDVSR